MKVALSLFSAIMSVGVAAAGSCRPAVVSTYHAPVVVKKAVIAEIVPVAVYAPLAVAVPVYGGAYVPPVVNAVPVAPAVPAAPAPAAQPSDLQQILTAIRQVDTNVRNIDDRVKALEAKVNGAPLPQPKADTPPLVPKTPLPKESLESSQDGEAVSILTAKCASCHSDGNASVKMSDGSLKGGGFVMFQGGKLTDLPEKKWGRVSTKISTLSMPPKRDADGKDVPPLSDEDAAKVSAFIDKRLR